jgi:predicted Zn finger-like uncharacterized protein
MEVRCTGCNKLFRVSDDKIQGSGVKFPCTRCGNSIKITGDDFERYQSSKKTVPADAPAEPEPAPILESPVPQMPAQMPQKSEDGLFDLSGPAEAAEAMQKSEEEMPAPAQSAPVKPQPSFSPAAQISEPETKPETQAEIKPEIKMKQQPAEIQPRPAPKTKPETAVASKPEKRPVPDLSPATPAAPLREGRSASTASDVFPPQPGSPASSVAWKKAALVAFAIIVIVAGAAGVMHYQASPSKGVRDAAPHVIPPDGLEIRNSSGTVEPLKQDLIISGIIENKTDKPKDGWCVLAEVYDAQGTVLIRSKNVNGKQLYTSRDFEIMARRGENIESIKAKQLQEPGRTIPARGSVNFEIRIMEPPSGIASFNPILQPFDPVQLFKETAAERK